MQTLDYMELDYEGALFTISIKVLSISYRVVYNTVNTSLNTYVASKEIYLYFFSLLFSLKYHHYSSYVY